MDTGFPEPGAVTAPVRTSTRELQDPVASYSRQVCTMTGWLPPGWYLAAIYADVESGGTDLDVRSQNRVLSSAVTAFSRSARRVLI